MRRRLIPAVVLLTLCLFAAPQTVSAGPFDFFKGVCNNGGGNSTVCKDQPVDAQGNTVNPLAGPEGLLAGITNIVAFVAGAAAIIMIIISAIKFITSGSDLSTGSRTDTDVEDARRGLANAVIGLAVIVLARTIIIYVLNRI